MKLVGVRQAQARLSDLLDLAQREGIILTRHGRPVALITGVEDMDLEDIVLSQDPNFWKLIAARRKSRKPLVSHEELAARTKRELALGRPRRGQRSHAKGTQAGRGARGKQARESARLHSKRTQSRA